MDSAHNTVFFCCVAKRGRILSAYSRGDHEIDNLAALCVERSPPYHRRYFQTVGKRTFGFLMEDGYVYFAIVDDSLGNAGLLRFLEHVRKDFKNVTRKGLKGSISNLNSICLQEQLLLVIRQLITSLENVSPADGDWAASNHGPPNEDLRRSMSYSNADKEATTSSKALLLGKSSKQDKKMKNHVIAMKDAESEEHWKSTDRGLWNDSDSNNHGVPISSPSLQREMGSMRMRTTSQSTRKKWCRQIRIVLAIDAVICIILFVIWLVICQGFKCTR
ncbi:hypothetical protein Nepgr_033247 [Nepenthes gracilis]|uniref:Longin domain-containing protein n=1 Tax=Nepenthes gracilis TaxID=150966 RepID=A0AAD3TLJ5_NEPGR|nr:hypothetical protein Nepgr_033247 [Nepenthes gracilis]